MCMTGENYPKNARGLRAKRLRFLTGPTLRSSVAGLASVEMLVATQH